MSVKNWWTSEKSKIKSFKKTAGKYIGIALAVILGALLIYGIYELVKRHSQNAQAAKLNAEATALQGGRVRVARRAYMTPVSLEGGRMGWRMMRGQRIVPA